MAAKACGNNTRRGARNEYDDGEEQRGGIGSLMHLFEGRSQLKENRKRHWNS